ncbi:hypothetical protein RJZ56_004653 [Blastomyces dermatitidis]|uniref:DNA damage-responsive protein 48 n=2 Tax=Ajellomyces dermatitidis TaxID=5039 RepID=F2TIL1_AJEDA|nr:uncharacterized protein BDCG_07701 [Blastomyces dermatitidis ER-3]EEQ92581.1 hypothetical protein BDCG_07701 [Blastomyces dermatitidis ER-3]EGE83074.1 hypothetical protein BDDG_06018 [Blastomyces dermatitidis ATCC 18188]EQL30420.1 hypothetical protein BDFG_07107 [Blastomyces dermatitidis ATCC 26199]
MDFINKIARSQDQQKEKSSATDHKKQGAGGFLSGFGDKLNSAAGGGRESEKNEDMLDKSIDFVQERFLGQGPQDNESALEQAKDEKISDFIRDQYKNRTGKDFPIKDKKTRFG